ncbi:hypothetical protein ACE38V_03265 [Cytobacillus sp. Hz8]|uniref:YqgU-like beta propeller domain-containing protein n=1 Tax=Cytobacillus sp. Hz8 TaxID=3347168 RepID=UPI0035D6E805
MKSKISNDKANFLFLFMIIIVSALLIASGCERNKEFVSHKANKEKKTHEINNQVVMKDPIVLEDRDFYSIYGWLDDHTIFFTTEENQGGSVYEYDLINGRKKLLYKSEYPIVTAAASYSKKRILLQSSKSSYMGILTVLDRGGKVYFSKEIPSTELSFEWNQYDEDKLLVSAFKEDWSFQSFLVNVVDNAWTPLKIKQPFADWLDKNELLYLDWDNDKLSLFAPLIKMNLDDGNTSKIEDHVFQVHTLHDHLLTITVNENDREHAIYSFYTDSLKKVRSIKLFQLTRYSDWLVPFFDYDVINSRFITFQPLNSGDVDFYNKGFQLVSYSLKDDSQEMILDDMKNEPLSCSPSGNYCLYGNYLENLIDMKTKKIMKLVKETSTESGEVKSIERAS